MTKKTERSAFALAAVALAVLLASAGCGPSLESQARAAAAGEELYYGIEIKGKLRGYAHVTTSALSEDPREGIRLDHEIVIKGSLLGSGVDSETRMTYHLDPAGDRFSHYSVETRQGARNRVAEVTVEGETVRLSSWLLPGERTFPLASDVVLENTLMLPHLKADFVDRGYTDLLADLEGRAHDGDQTAAIALGRFGRAASHALHRSSVSVTRNRQPTIRELLVQMAIPRTYIFGEKSLPDKDFDLLPSLGVAVGFVPEAGHAMTTENPEGFAQVIATFLQS